MLVLSFPALRGVPTKGLQGPTNTGAAAGPSVDDALPVLTEFVDHRLDSLKQWIVNSYVRADVAGSRAAETLETFRTLVSKIAHPAIQLIGVDRESWEVLVETADGVVPIDFVSQGMSSVLAWIGTVLQRMYEVYPEDSNPTKRDGLVLLDEIDAHLHPAWQRTLIPAIRTAFPRLQVIATSHSPLVTNPLA